jgi:hypothetical protein
LRFRVSVELAVEKASISEKDAYKQILDIPLKDNLVYIVERRILSGAGDTVFEDIAA